MLEMMSRDGSVSMANMERAADYVEGALGVDVDILDIDDIRGMVFWSPEDVMISLRELGFKEPLSLSDLDDYNLCAGLLQDCEAEIHKAMLEAGRKAMETYLKQFMDEYNATPNQ